MATTARARVEIKCRLFGMNGSHEVGAHNVLSNKATIASDDEEEIRIRYGLANLFLTTPIDEIEEALEELYDELFPD